MNGGGFLALVGGVGWMGMAMVVVKGGGEKRRRRRRTDKIRRGTFSVDGVFSWFW